MVSMMRYCPLNDLQLCQQETFVPVQSQPCSSFLRNVNTIMLTLLPINCASYLLPNRSRRS
jgi:hypothetical protein